ncbi:MAG TPA: hypothetical protein VGH58_10775 [Solirubrobacterales bacterium]|jgi:hypothetical protein
MSPNDELNRLWLKLDDEQRKLVEVLAADLSTHTESVRADLFDVAHRLDDKQVARLLDVARVMAQPIIEKINASSGVLEPEFVAEFRARLQAHHATHTTQMDRLGFENAFLSASRAAGFDATEAPSRTTRFYDATISDERVALKTEGAKSLKADKLHISKLSEAAWIQDMRSARKRYERSMEFIDAFLAAVDRIFMLRYYQASPTPHYELVEIPVSHFERVRELTPSDFESDAPRVMILDEEGEIMEFRLDRSDSKITIGKIAKSRCVVHAEWRLAQGDEPL